MFGLVSTMNTEETTTVINNQYLSIWIICIGIATYYISKLTERKNLKNLVIDPVVPPDKVEAIIQDRPDVIAGAERSIAWFSERHKKTPICVVFLHGWSSSRQECRPIPEKLATSLQANLYFGRLPGHGTENGSSLKEEATPENLRNEALLALRVGKSLGEKVVLVGMSTGAVLLTWLVSQTEATDIQSLIVISPAYALGHPAYPVMKHVFRGLRSRPYARTWLLEFIMGKHRSLTPVSKEHEKFWTLNYPTAALLNLFDVLHDCAFNPSDIHVPTLLVGNSKDHVVNFSVAIKHWINFGGKTKQLFCLDTTEHPHCIASEILSPSNVEKISKIIITFAQTNT